MATKKILLFFRWLALMVALMPAMAAGTATDPSFAEYMETVYENNELEMAVLILVNENDIPVSDVIAKARERGYGFTRVVDALMDTKLSPEEVIIAVLLNGAPPAALFDSKKIRDDHDYTPERILEFLVGELRFMTRVEEELGEEDRNLDTRDLNIEAIIRVCDAMMADEDFSEFDIMSILCRADAGDVLIAKVAERFDVPPAVIFLACPRHAEYGHAYISKELPHKAYYVIGVDHMTIDDDAGKGEGVISPMRP
jgi:hypothetical protein